MCFLICLGCAVQAQQREIISVSLKTLPGRCLFLVAHPIPLIKRCTAGSLGAAGRDSGELCPHSVPLDRARFGEVSYSPAAAAHRGGEMEISPALFNS